MKYIEVEKLKDEIKSIQCEQGFSTGEAERAYQFAIEDILVLIDSLQQEQTKSIWHDMNETPKYPCDILFITNVDNMFLYRYMENGRPVDKETPYFNNILNGKCWCYCSDIINK